ARAATLPACVARADLAMQRYYGLLQDAEYVGAKDRLLQYLDVSEPYDHADTLRRGLLAEGFFVPSLDMLRFRAAAIQARAEQKFYTVMGQLPGLEVWFADCALPERHRGKRRTFSKDLRAASSPAAANAAPTVATASAGSLTPRGGRPRSPETEAVYQF